MVAPPSTASQTTAPGSSYTPVPVGKAVSPLTSRSRRIKLFGPAADHTYIFGWRYTAGPSQLPELFLLA